MWALDMVGLCLREYLALQGLFTDDSKGAVEVFIIGAALSTTSLGTTFVVINSASKSFDFSQSKVGTVLISAAVFDDVSGLIMAR